MSDTRPGGADSFEDVLRPQAGVQSLLNGLSMPRCSWLLAEGSNLTQKAA